MSNRRTVPPFSIPSEAFEKFEALAKAQDKSVAQAMRTAMQEYLNKYTGQVIDFNVGEWGGRRERDDAGEGKEE